MVSRETREASACALWSCDRRPRDGRLCQHHRRQLGRMLDPDYVGRPFDPDDMSAPVDPASISNLYFELDVQYARAGEPVNSRTFRSTPPGDVALMSLGDPRTQAERGRGGDNWDTNPPYSVPGTLLRIIARTDRRTIDGDTEVKPRRRASVRVLATWLHLRTDWLVEQEWIEGAYAGLRALHSQLRAATGDPASRPVGTCRQLVDEGGQLIREGWRPAEDGTSSDPTSPHYGGPWRCAWPLFLPSQAPRAMDEPVQLPSLRCWSCGWSYGPLELVQLGRERENAA